MSCWAVLAAILLLGLLLQSYHQVEHSVKLAQFLQTHMQGTKGILGARFDLVLLHFILNLLVYLPLVGVFFGAGLPAQLNVRFFTARKKPHSARRVF